MTSMAVFRQIEWGLQSKGGAKTLGALALVLKKHA
jgi:hypothetical protein